MIPFPPILVIPLSLLITAVSVFFLLRAVTARHRQRWADHVHRRVFAGYLKEQNPVAALGATQATERTNKLLGELDAAVIVCGDIARSPRMQYHAVSLCGLFGQVHVVGANMNNRCCDDLEKLRDAKKAVFNLVTEDESTKAKNAGGGATSWITRVIARVLSLFGRYLAAIWVVCNDNDHLALVLCQTPPVIPTLPLVWLVTTLVNLKRAFKHYYSGTKAHPPPNISVVFDVHNLGWTILRAEKRPLAFQMVYYFLEWLFVLSGSACNTRITVSQALGAHLKSMAQPHPWARALLGKKENAPGDFPVVVMPDAAPDFFRPSSRDELWKEVFSHNPPKFEFGAFGNNLPAAFADREAAAVAANDKDILLVAGSTSWTADDDYTIVVDALKKADEALQRDYQEQQQRGGGATARPKHLWLFISGKGPARSVFENQVKEANLSARHITVTTGYFQSFTHYALFLGAADVGLCMHLSSSGLDLPMKGVDMLGCGLPMCALRYEPALSELVTQRTGWLFSTGEELAGVWTSLLLDDDAASSTPAATAANEHHDEDDDDGGEEMSASSNREQQQQQQRSPPRVLRTPRQKLERKQQFVRRNREFWKDKWTLEVYIPVCASLILKAGQ